MGDDIETEPLRLVTSDGIELEAEARVPPSPSAAVVLAHPHPAHGGSMRSLVTSELFRELPTRGLAALRFNFRGVGTSGGGHGGGRPEREDVLAAVHAWHDRFPALPLVLCGWSFGADVSASITDPDLAGWVLVAPPLRILPLDELVAGRDPRPKLLVVPEHDQFRPPDGVREHTADWVAATIEVIPGADHFLAGRTGRAAELVVGFAATLG